MSRKMYISEKHVSLLMFWFFKKCLKIPVDTARKTTEFLFHSELIKLPLNPKKWATFFLLFSWEHACWQTSTCAVVKTFGYSKPAAPTPQWLHLRLKLYCHSPRWISSNSARGYRSASLQSRHSIGCLTDQRKIFLKVGQFKYNPADRYLNHLWPAWDRVTEWSEYILC